MNDFTIADTSYNKKTGELEQFLVFWSNGEPELKRASAENVLLFDPEDELPFENGMYGFLNGDHALILSEDPELLIAPTSNEYAYLIRLRGTVVETTPEQSQTVLEGVLEVARSGDPSTIIDLHHSIMDSQVRQDLVNVLYQTFDQTERIDRRSNGWLVDGYYLVDWNASIYTADDDPDEEDYVRRGDTVEKDGSHEFVELRMSRAARDLDPETVTISGDRYQLSEREMLFLAKVKWLLARRHYHPDESFWMTADRNIPTVDSSSFNL